MGEMIIEKTEDSIRKIMEQGITAANIDNLYKLAKINHIAKEDRNMNYGTYGARRPEYDSYGNYSRDNYGRNGYDTRYRGNEYIDKMHDEYGRYMDNRSRYGANEETNRSFHYMVKALEDFIKVLHEEADNPQQKQQLKEALQRSMM